MSYLLMIGCLETALDEEEKGTIFDPARGRIKDFGFCADLDGNISCRPPRPDRVPYDAWCEDRFLIVRPDASSRSIGHIEIVETLVYDSRMRGEIDFTGYRATVSLQPDAYSAYVEYIGKVKSSASPIGQTGWGGSVLFRVPLPTFRAPDASRQFGPLGVRKSSCRPPRTDQAVGLR